MDLKNKRVAVRIDNPKLRWQQSELLMKNGAAVHRARNEEELRLFVERLGVEVVVATVVAEDLKLYRNSICRN